MSTYEVKASDPDWTIILPKLLETAEQGDTIIVHDEVRRSLTQAAANRMGRQDLVIKSAEE
jgi:hypothetical protein